ncbi:MAG TPA: hypothetical protein ENN69_03090 [Spirochaetia bacterium]|nr:hypothetical protein [Spirochaetia bacterium]
MIEYSCEQDSGGLLLRLSGGVVRGEKSRDRTTPERWRAKKIDTMKTKPFLSLLILLPLFFSVYSCADEYAGFEKIDERGDRYVSVAEGLPFYRERNVASAAIGVIPPAEKVSCVFLLKAEAAVEWYFVEWNGTAGWVRAEDRTGYPYTEVLIQTKINISHAYFNEIKHRLDSQKDAPEKNHEKSKGYFDSALEDIQHNDFTHAEKNAFSALYYDSTWARAYYLYAKILIMEAAPEDHDLIVYYLTRALELGYKYLYQDMSRDAALKDFSDLINGYAAARKLTETAAERYEQIREHGLTVSMVMEVSEEYDPEEFSFDPDDFSFAVGYISLGPFREGKGHFLSIDGERSLSARFGFEMTESLDFTPAENYTIRDNGKSLDIYLDCRVVRGSESLMDGGVVETDDTDTIHIHLEDGNDYCESGVLGKRAVTLDFDTSPRGK